MTMTWIDLAAETWDATGGDDPQWDHDYFRQVIAENPGPALDVGCGTGRLLVRFLDFGLTVEGMDTSADMLRICRQKAEAKGLHPVLYQQSMITMDLPHTYQTIIVPCGSFMLVLDREEAKQTLSRFYAHLNLGGVLAMSFFDMAGPDKERPVGEWKTVWRIEKMAGFPDDAVLEVSFFTKSIDRIEQVSRGQRHYRLLQNGKLVREQYLEDTFRWYTPNEIRLLLKAAGFTQIKMVGNETDEPLNESHWAMLVTAKKE